MMKILQREKQELARREQELKKISKDLNLFINEQIKELMKVQVKESEIEKAVLQKVKSGYKTILRALIPEL